MRVAEEIGAFADISGITTPYADALSRQGVVNIGAPYPPHRLVPRPAALRLEPLPRRHEGRRHAWRSWLNAGVPPSPTVQFAAGASTASPACIGVVGPENPEYGELRRPLRRAASRARHPPIGLTYRIDINSMPNQASNIIAQLKDAGVTTVVCSCDPVMLALGMAPKANEQDYNPEWITGGLAFVEQDIVGQLIDPEQWQHTLRPRLQRRVRAARALVPAFGVPGRCGPTSEPAFGVEELYYQMYLLAIGLQMAGPNLTPETFEQGMFAYPGAVGPRGNWHFAPGRLHVGRRLPRDLVGPRPGVGARTAEPGAWVQLNGGARYSRDVPPTGPRRLLREDDRDRRRHDRRARAVPARLRAARPSARSSPCSSCCWCRRSPPSTSSRCPPTGRRSRPRRAAAETRSTAAP